MTYASITSPDLVKVEEVIGALQFVTEPAGLVSWLSIYMEPYLMGRIRQRFIDEGDDASGKWAPLSDATREIRENLGYPGAHPINVRSGALYNFVTENSDTGITVDQADLRIPGSGGSNKLMEKLVAAQVGLAAPSTPARPVLALSAKDAIFATTSLGNFITTAMLRFISI